jgi:hypothetical protein
MTSWFRRSTARHTLRSGNTNISISTAPPQHNSPSTTHQPSLATLSLPMSSFIEKIKAKTTHRKSGSQGNTSEPTYSIQPHPAVSWDYRQIQIDIDHSVFCLQKTNDPADLNPPQPGGGLNSGPATQAHRARDPHVPSQKIANSLEQPLVSLLLFCSSLYCI